MNKDQEPIQEPSDKVTIEQEPELKTDGYSHEDWKHIANLYTDHGFNLLIEIIEKSLYQTVIDSVDVINTEEFEFRRHRIGAYKKVLHQLKNLPRIAKEKANPKQRTRKGPGIRRTS